MKLHDADVIVCQGTPYCDLEGGGAVKNQLAGCTLCKRIWIDELTGKETEHDPLEAKQ